MSPFYANYRYYPHATAKVRTERSTYEHPAAETLIDHPAKVHTKLQAELKNAQRDYKCKYDQKANPTPSFKVRDLVWLNRKNIKTTQPSLKLDFKQFSPFKITKVVGESKLAFELELPPQWCIHNVFHASLPEYVIGRLEPGPPP